MPHWTNWPGGSPPPQSDLRGEIERFRQEEAVKSAIEALRQRLDNTTSQLDQVEDLPEEVKSLGSRVKRLEDYGKLAVLAALLALQAGPEAVLKIVLKFLGVAG